MNTDKRHEQTKNKTKERRPLMTRVSPETHRRFKAKCAHEELTIQEALEKLMDGFVDGSFQISNAN